MPDIQFSLLNTKVKLLLLDLRQVYSNYDDSADYYGVRAATNQEKKKVAFRKDKHD